MAKLEVLCSIGHVLDFRTWVEKTWKYSESTLAISLNFLVKSKEKVESANICRIFVPKLFPHASFNLLSKAFSHSVMIFEWKNQSFASNLQVLFSKTSFSFRYLSTSMNFVNFFFNFCVVSIFSWLVQKIVAIRSQKIGESWNVR